MSRINLTPRLALASFNRERTIEQYVKRNNRTIYGAQAVAAQIGGLARNTRDYDIATPRPRQDTNKLTRILNRQAGYPEYYSAQSKRTKGVFKVIDRGPDFRKGTADDYTILDATKRKLPFVVINGIRYARLSSTLADKRKALSDKQYAFRHAKDREDELRIQAYQSLRRRR